MKGLILDRGLPRAATSLLRATSVEAVHVAELGMAAASDEAILEYARDKTLIVVTLDADFHTQLALSGESAPSVIRLRVQGLKSTGATELIRSVITKARAELQAGALVSVAKKLIRIKRLPITK